MSHSGKPGGRRSAWSIHKAVIMVSAASLPADWPIGSCCFNSWSIGELGFIVVKELWVSSVSICLHGRSSLDMLEASLV